MARTSFLRSSAAMSVSSVALLAGLSVIGPVREASAQQAAGGGDISLEAVNVQAPDWQVLTEGKDTYTSAITSTGVGSPTSWKQIPQSISTVTSQRIQDQGFTQLEEAMSRTTGMVILQNDLGRSSIFSRGYEVDQMLVNGLPAPLSSIYGTQPDLAIFDRLDVLKGPAGLYYGGTGAGGNSGPSGVVNGILKPAVADYFLNAELTGGSWDYGRAQLDAGGKLNAAGTVRGRIVAAYQDADSFVDYNENKVWLGYGTLAFDITENTTLSLYAWHQERDMLPFNGLPAVNLGGGVGQLLNVPRNTFIGATWNTFNNATTDYVAELEHKFDNGGEAKASVRYSDRSVNYRYAYGGSAVSMAPATLGNLSMQYTAAQYTETSLSGDAHVTTPFEAFGQTHEVTGGFAFSTVDTNLLAPTSTTLPGTYNIFAFNPASVPVPTTIYNRQSLTDPTQWGAYGQAKIKPLQPLTLLLGGRFAWYDNTSNVTTVNTANGAVTTTSAPVNYDGEFVPYAGLVLDLTKEVSAYISYTDTFTPQTELDANGDALQPRQGYQYEGGLKGSFFDGALNASAAMFLIRDTNRALATANPNVYVAAGETQVSGYELEISGKLAPGWEVYAGYTYTETEYLTATAAQITTGFSTFTPRNNFNLWTKYEFQDPRLQGLHIAGGVKHLSSFYTKSGGVTLTAPEYTTVDAQVGYKFNKHLQATFTATNIFDEDYYTRVGSTALFNFYGEPRAYWLKVSATY
ncbi:TonB-dependent siderophore receptor [Aquabacter cavernae]|uniref:TonB-dependent siderophore receptor n=1 Tax=Aquabacter cavernae TaxID=2496029 RepID=UPI000F8CA0BD|nr:TonB-dependent siderophore receptor [Aquabacter cavernae]